MKTYIGIDNGVTGAFALVSPDEQWQFAPVSVLDCGRDRLLDIPGNLDFIRHAAEQAGGRENLVVVCERQLKNPLFGAKGNFANGRNGEFWRVLLTLEGIPFCWVDPRTWQKQILQGIAGTDTKKMARLFLKQRYPGLKLEDQFGSATIEGVRDALCIALWARMNSK